MEKVLRSLIHEKIPFDLRVKLDLLSRRRDIINREKQEELIKLLREFNIEGVIQLGPGTNRYAFRLDGFVIKVATDNDGKIDNLKEFKMAKRLVPDVTKIYEVSENGSILVCEYIQPFTSYAEMLKYADKIRAILKKFSTVYLIGDVGITPVNYSNWGVRIGTDEPVCLDFAYIYNVSSDIFLCRYCNNGTMLVPDSDFVYLLCPNKACGRKYTFADIRARLGDDIHRQEIGDLTEEGYTMTESNVNVTLDENRSNYLKKIKPKKEAELANQIVEDEFIDDFKLDNMEGNNMAIKKFNFGNGSVTINTTQVFRIDLDKDEKPVVKEEPQVVFASDVKPITPAVEKVKVEDIEGDVEDPEEFDIPVVNAKEVEPVTDDEEDEDDEYCENLFTKENIDQLDKAISKLSNKIGAHMREINLYDEVSSFIKDKKMYPDTFYKGVQNAIFRSLMIFCNFSEQDVPNTNGNGTHKEFFRPEYIYDPKYLSTLIFILRFWTNRSINSADPNDVYAEYCDIYDIDDDKCDGIQHTFIPVLKERLTQKMPINVAGIDIIVNTIEKLWCNTADDIISTPEGGLHQALVDEAEEEIRADYEDDTNNLSNVPPELVYTEEDNADEEDDEVAFSAEVEDVEETDDEEDEESYEHQGTSQNNVATKIVLLRNSENKGYDLIKLYTADDYDNICIPFYVGHKTPYPTGANSINERNGVWDWMTHVMPDGRFYTSNPDMWLEYNNCTSEPLSILKFVILKEISEDLYLMGFSAFAGVIEVDNNGAEEFVNDHDMLGFINRTICFNMYGSHMSHYDRSIITAEDNVITETEVDDMIAMLLDQFEGESEDDEDDIPYPDPIPEEDENEEDEYGEMSETEAAAIAALMGGQPLPESARVVPIVEDDMDDDDEEDVVDTTSYDDEDDDNVLAYKDPEDDGNTPLLFTPIRRK